MLSFFGLISLLVCLQKTALGLPEFQRRIPNGDRVTSPTGEEYPGVGHHRSNGGGARNSFGQDFAAAGFKWTKELCEKDSDCDGLTNGQELGDPECIWQEGDTPQFDVGITHPGIADADRSIVSAKKDEGGLCADFSFDNLPSNYVNTSFVMPDYQVPTERTTYVKYAFRLDISEDSYAVRFAPIIQHPEVVHHMLLYSCDQEPTNFKTPNTQGNMPCSNLVYAWAVGGKEQCMPENVGFDLDSSKPWYVLDVHYDNPRGLPNIQDDSGLTITSFPKSAAGNLYQAAGWFFSSAGQNRIQIPAKRSIFEIQAECSFPEIPTTGLTVFAYAMHAHQLGRKVWTEVHSRAERRSLTASCPLDCANRLFGLCHLCFSEDGCCGSQDPSLCSEDGCCSSCSACDGCEGCYPEHNECNPDGYQYSSNTYDLGCDTRFDFDLQEVRPLPEPQKIYPSDKFITHCVYNSMDRTSTTFGGDASDEEMCMGFYMYYPRIPDLHDCSSSKVQLDFGDGEHTCQIPGLEVNEESLCDGPGDLNSDLSYAGFSSLDLWLKVHIVSMQLSLGFLLPVGVLIPMSFREAFTNNSTWFKCHRMINITGLLIMLVGVAFAFQGVAGRHFTELHHIVGVAVITFALLQPLNAFFRPHHDDNQGFLSRSTWEMIHKSFGRLVIVGAWCNIFFGIKLLEDLYGTSQTTSLVFIGVQATIIGVLSIVAIYRAVTSRRISNHKYTIDQEEV